MSHRSRSSLLVLDVVEEYLRTKLAREPKTHAAYSGVLLGSTRGTKPPLGTALAPYFQGRRIRTLSHDEVAGWVRPTCAWWKARHKASYF